MRASWPSWAQGASRMSDRDRDNQDCAHLTCGIPNSLIPGRPQPVLPLGLRSSSRPCTNSDLQSFLPEQPQASTTSPQDHLFLCHLVLQAGKGGSETAPR